MKDLTYDDKHSLLLSASKPAPLVLIVPTWMGMNAFAQTQAKNIANLGYHAFLVDLFGAGKVAQNAVEARALITPFFERPQKIRDTLERALAVAKELPGVTSIGAIGFCFGGTCVIELAKGGANLAGVVSFHAALTLPPNITQMPAPLAEKIPTPLLILDGYRDPRSLQADVQTLQEALDKAEADWQLITYGKAMHAFTNPEANDPQNGLVYDAKTHARSWHAMVDFFQETFNLPFSERSSPSA